MMVAPAVAAAPPGALAAAGPARVTVLSDPGDSPQAIAELTGRHDLDHGIAVCQPQPGATSPELLAGDLLIALGKLPGALAAEHLSRRGWELAALWLAAEQVRHLIVLRADRLPAGCWSELAAASGVRVWLLTAKMRPGQRAALEACATAGPAAHRPWHTALAELPAADGSRTGGYGFPPVLDAEFPLFRATAARLLNPAAFAQVDTVYRDTYARARGHNTALRHASGGDCAGAVLQQLTIDAASADEVLTRLRAAQAGLFADGLLLDLRPGRHPPWELRAGCLRPRLDHATVARLRGLADPVVAAAVTLSRATAMTPSQLCALRRRDVIQAGTGLRVRAGRLTYRIPARAAGPVRAAVLHQPPAPDGGLASAAGQALLLVTPGGAPISETALQRLRHHGAARAGVALPAGSFRDWVITDLCAPSRARP
jgi:hypothetical protein